MVLKSGTGNNRIFGMRGSLAPEEIRFGKVGAGNPGFEIFYQPEPYGMVFRYFSYETCSSNPAEGRAKILRAIETVRLKSTGTQGISGIYGNFTISCSTKIGVSLPEIYEAMYTYRAWSGDPVDENSPFCTTTIPSVADFGQVNKGSSKEIKLTGTLVCDKDADVDANLLVQFSSEKGVLNLTGTKIHFGFDDNSVLKRFKLKANTPVNFPVIFKVADTGDTAGLKDGYVLLRTEVP